MLKRLILLIGVFLGSHVITAQTPAPEFVSAQELVAPIVTAAPTSSLAASVLLPEDLGKSAARFGHLFAGTYERDQSLKGLDRLSPMHEVKTCFSRNRSCHSYNCGVDVCGSMASLARFTCRTCSLVPQPEAVCRTFVSQDRVIPRDRVPSISTASA
jgi:hypothetical protein